MGQPNKEAIERFFDDLFGDSINERAQLVLWSSRDKRSHWASSVQEASAIAEANAGASDLYFGVALQDPVAAREERTRRTGEAEPSMAFARGYATTTAVIPGVWLDLDLAGEGHEKLGLPRNQDDADKILAELPFPPSRIIATGGGAHIYWLFREPWVIESAEERDRAAAVVKGWQRLAIDAAANMGFTLDATHDLSRVLRPVGTVNHKYGSEVLLRNDEAKYYNPSEFEDWADQVQPLLAPVHSNPEDLGDLHENVQPPVEKLMAMLNLAPKFAATWRRERKEFPSQSEYDMSLASMTAKAGWTDHEIAALVVSHRKAGMEPLRLDRPAYFTKLIGKAKQGMVAEEAHERIHERVEAVQSGGATAEDEREGFLTDISNMLGFRIRRILKFVTDPPQYRLVLDEGCIHLGGVDAILNPKKFREAIAGISGHLIQRMTGAAWDPVAQALLQAVEELDLGADSSAEGLVEEWLGEYLSQHRPAPDRQEAIPIREPFIDPDGQPAFFLSEFRSWLAFHRDERLGRRQIATLLRSSNCTPRIVSYLREADGHKSTVHVWVAPTSIAARLPKRGISDRTTDSVQGLANH
tara:strand:- start:1827 stop:3578 length:1752 start_codon:yes stop_codon:yes gene_type:complete